MKVFKPLQASLLHKTFDWEGKQRFSVSLLFGFSFQGGEPLLEPELWKIVPKELGPTGILDMGMPKPHGEVLVYGKYFAPGKTPVTNDRVRLKIGPLEKELLIIGNRYWRTLLGPSEPEPFREMPLDYAHAFGGPGFGGNPIGKGMIEVDVCGEMRRPLPNIEDPDHLMTSSGQRPNPAGCGPLDMTWGSRASKLGTYDDQWLRERAPGYPADLDWTHFNTAPPDQWLNGFFSGDEAFELINMHPERMAVRGRLPGFRARCFIERKGDGSVDEIGTRAETVWLFPRVEIGVVLYRGVIDIDTDDASDISHLMVAYENLSDPPRAKQHYLTALAQRIDPDQALKYMMDTTDLIPSGARCGFAAMLEQEAGSESEIAKNQQARGEMLKEETKAKLEAEKARLEAALAAKGLDPTPVTVGFNAGPKPATNPKIAELHAIAAQILPDSKRGAVDLKSIDLSKTKELAAKAEELALQEKSDAKARLLALSQQLAAIPGAAKEKAKVDEALKAMERPPLFPRPPGDELIRKLEAQKAEVDRMCEDLRRQGTDESKLPKFDMDFEAVRAKLAASRRQMKEAYRMQAHFMERGRPAHEGSLGAVRDDLLARLKRNEKVSDGDFAGIDLSHQNLRGVDFSGCFLEAVNLGNADLSGANLEGAILAFANLSRCKLSGANLRLANLGATDATEAVFEGADMREARLGRAVLSGAKLMGCDLTGAEIMETRFACTDLSGVTLPQGNYMELDLSRSKFAGAILPGSTFTKCNLEGCDFTGAIVEESTWVESKLDGANFTEARMRNTRFPGGCSLRGARFLRAGLEAGNLRDTDLRNADFSGADLTMCDFGAANAQQAVFTGATAKSAQFINTDLAEADLSSVNLMEGSLLKARLTSATLRNANCYGVEFMKATVGGTDFSGTNLEQTKLEHWSPS